MSWNFKHIGTRAGVNAKVQAEPYLPTGLKLVVAQIATAPGSSSNGLSVESCGHVDSTLGGTVSKFEVGVIHLELDPAPAPAQADAAEAPPPPP